MSELPGCESAALTEYPGLREEGRASKQDLHYWRNLAQQTSERLRLAMDAGCFGIWDWRIPENRIIREGYHEELFGVERRTFAGTYEDFLACVHPEDRAAVQ